MRASIASITLGLALLTGGAACAAPAESGDTTAGASSSAKPKGKKTSGDAKIGQKVKDGKFTFTVTKISEKTTAIGNEIAGQKPQGKFVLVSMTVHNHGKEAQLFSGDSQKLLAGGKEYSADTEAAIYLEDAKSLLEEINPGNTVEGIVIFDVPKTVKPSVLELHDSPFSGGVRVDVKKK